MTLCIGWVQGEAVYLIADSALTGSAAPTNLQSSFGETHRRIRGDFVEEGLFKLAPIGSEAAAAFAGNWECAEQIRDFLMQNWCVLDGDIDALQVALSKAFYPSIEEFEVSFLLAWRTKDGPKLAHWVPSSGFRYCDQCSIGSASDSLLQLLERSVLEMRRSGIPEQHVLPAMSAFAQSLGVHDDLLEQNIGGAMFGVQVDQNGVSWQPDTAYVLCRRGAPAGDVIRLCLRGDALVVQSPFSTWKVLMNGAVSDWKKWVARWKGVIDSEVLRDHCPYVVFVRKDARVVTIVERVPGTSGRFMRFRAAAGDLHLDVTEELISWSEREQRQGYLVDVQFLTERV